MLVYRCKRANETDAVSFVAWADNADACSKQYAGTGALKTDFTRYTTSNVAAIMFHVS